MCCLPNRFPLPVYLLLNKSDMLEKQKRPEWLNDHKINQYFAENQFINKFWICSEVDSKPDIGRETLQSTNTISSVEVEHPLKDMLNFVLRFSDLREKIMGINFIFMLNRRK